MSIASYVTGRHALSHRKSLGPPALYSLFTPSSALFPELWVWECFGRFLDNLNNNSKKGNSCLLLGMVLVRLSLVLRQSTVSPVGHKHAYVYYILCIYIHTHMLMCIISFFNAIVNSMIAYGSFRHLYCYIILSLSFGFIFPIPKYKPCFSPFS